MKKKLIIVKAGTTSLTGPAGDIDREKIKEIVRQLSALKDEGHSVALVSSGAIAAGFRALGYPKRPADLAGKQASAAVGQGLLMEEYTRFFGQAGYVTAQLLLTAEDFTDHRRYKNAFSAAEMLLSRGAIPIINENDTVSIDEIKLGDNDTLAARFASMMHADLLVLLTDVDGLYTKDPARYPDAELIPVVEAVDETTESLAGGAGSSVGTGGMATKVRGAKLATRAGVPVFVCSSKEPDSVIRAVRGEARGTLFCADEKLRTKTQWLAFYAPAAGTLTIDDGAERAVADGTGSLLLPGVSAIDGDFSKGEAVEIVNSSGEKIGRGLAYSDSAAMKAGNGGVAVHRDDLFIIRREDR